MALDRTRRRALAKLLFLLLTMVSIAAAQNPKPSAIMDQYRAQRITWTTNIWPYANSLFGILALIEFAWSAAVMLLERTDLQSWTSALVRKMMWIGAFYALLLNGRLWIPAIIDSFEKIGQTASGFNQVAPSDIFAQGIDIAGALMATSSTAAFFQNLGTSLAMVFAAAVVAVAFTGITIQFIVAMVESYIVVAAGFIFLGFGGSRWTVPYTERYIGLAVSVGLKIMLLYLLIGTGMNLSVDWMTDAQKVSLSLNPAMSAFEIMGAALIFLMLCWQIPKLFSAVLGGAPALSGGDLVATATGVVAGAAAVSSFATGAGAAIAGGAASVAHAAGRNGAGGVSSAVTSVNGAMGTAGRTGGGTVPPPPSPPSGPSPNGHPRQPGPPTSGSGGSSRTRSAVLSSVGGESLASSGFEGERPASGFTTFSVPITPRARAEANSGDDSPRDQQPAGSGPPISLAPRPPSSETPSPGTGQTRRALSGLTSRLKNVRSRFGGLPSDSASHATPPRMPVEHDE
jgi:type IV secretion system protein TrbL